MLNPSNTKTAAIITIVGLLYIVSFLFSTEVFTDNSVISQSPVLTWCLLLAIIPSVVFCMLNLKLSLFISFISLGSLAALSALLIMYKNTLGFYVIENDVARKLIDNTNLKEFEDVTKISGGWIRNQTVTVLFYGKKEVNYDSSEKALIKADELKKVQDKFIKKVFEESAKRKDLGKPLIVSEDFKLLEIKNKGDNKLVLKMLDSIHYTKFPKNVIIMFNVNDHKNLKSNGFSRSVIEKFKNTGSKSKGSGKSDPPKSKDGPEGVSSGQQPSTPESENKDESGLDDSTRERAGNEDVTRADSKSRSEAPVNGRDTSNLPASEKKSTDEQPEEVISEGQQNINSDANLRTESADEGPVVEDSENVQSVADENHAVHSESVIADANAFTEPVSESPVVNEPENVQPVVVENEAVHSESENSFEYLITESDNESPVVNEPENIQPVVVENEAVHSESENSFEYLITESDNESPVVNEPENVQPVLGENQAVHSDTVIADANTNTESDNESLIFEELENIQPVADEIVHSESENSFEYLITESDNESLIFEELENIQPVADEIVHLESVIVDTNATAEYTNESPVVNEPENIQSVLGENEAVHSESVIADANLPTERTNESPVVNEPENIQPVVVENQAVHSESVIADANLPTEHTNESPVVEGPESTNDSNQKSSPEAEELEDIQAVLGENEAVHSESVIDDANAFTEPVSESPVVNEPESKDDSNQKSLFEEPENIQSVVVENEAVHSESVIADANLPTERTNESPVVNEPENIQPVVVENQAVHSESVIADANLPTEHTNESPVVEGPESTNDSNQKSSPEAEELEDIQAVLGENEAVHSESVIADANAFTEPVSESPVVNEPESKDDSNQKSLFEVEESENIQSVLGEDQAVHSESVIADANLPTEHTNESPVVEDPESTNDSSQKSLFEVEESENIQSVLGEDQAVHSESVIAGANATTEPVNESPVVEKPSKGASTRVKGRSTTKAKRNSTTKRVKEIAIAEPVKEFITAEPDKDKMQL